RGNQRTRHRVRAAGAGGDRATDAGSHRAGDRASTRNRARRRQDCRDGRRQGGGDRQARRTPRDGRTIPAAPRPAILRSRGQRVTTERAVLVLAEFDDVHNASAAHRVRALERLGMRTRAFDLGARPGLFSRLRGGDLTKRLERAIDEHEPDLVLVLGGSALDEELVDRLRGRTRARWITWLPDDLRTVSPAASLARPYDTIYAIGTDVSAELAERLGRTVDVLSLAADPSVYRPIR